MTLALWIVWSTTISLRQKLGLLVVFSLGGIIIAFAVVRAINILGRSYTDAVGLAVWGIAESSICMFEPATPLDPALLTMSSGHCRMPATVQDLRLAQQLDVRLPLPSCLFPTNDQPEATRFQKREFG